MSQQTEEVGRRPIRVRAQSSRALDQRLALRFPRLATGCLGLILRLPPSSRLRRAVVVRGVGLATEAFNRRDLDMAVSSWTPDTEFHPPREWVDAGFFKPSYRGRGGFREYVSTWSDVWGGDLRMEDVEVIDLGDRVVLLGNLPATSLTSGIPFAGRFATVSDLEGGVTVRVRLYFDPAEALDVVGLAE